MSKRKHLSLLFSAVFLCGISAQANLAVAESLREAFAYAYQNNPQLNAARAGLRATDEGVAIAKSGYRPTVNATGRLSKTWQDSGTIRQSSFGIEINQTVFDGFQTKNGIRRAKSGVKAARENLRNIEQNVLLNVAISYVDILRDQSILGFRNRSLEFLNEQVRSEKTRFDVGESTRTDVAQARGRLAGAQAQLSSARSNLEVAKSLYRRYVGKRPGRLSAPNVSFKNIPRSIKSATAIAMQNHPGLLAARHQVDQALFVLKQSEGELLPGVSVSGALNRSTHSINGNNSSASVSANLNVPIYQGGRVSAQVRRDKELLGQSRIIVDQTIDEVRQQIHQAYNERSAALQSVAANKSQLSAANLALEGAVEERKVGQRTTLDVLNTEQEVINARIALANSQRNLLVANYAILSSIGSLSASYLKLNTKRYDPEEHYIAVKDKWYGLRTPNGQ